MKPPRHPWVLTAVATLVTAAFLLPVYWMAKTSLTPPDRVLAPSPQWVPTPRGRVGELTHPRVPSPTSTRTF